MWLVTVYDWMARKWRHEIKNGKEVERPSSYRSQGWWKGIGGP